MDRSEDNCRLLADVVAAFPPDGMRLLEQTARLATDEMLVEISQADYGMDADEHYETVRAIRDSCRVPEPFRSHSIEVLALVRWSNPWDPVEKGGGIELHGHVKRAFCCAALLVAGSCRANDDYRIVSGQNDTLAALIESALALGGPLPTALARFLTCRIPTLDANDELRCFFTFGLLATSLLGRSDAEERIDVDSLVTFIERTEQAIRDPLEVCTPGMLRGSFLQLTGYKQRHALWAALAPRLAERFPHQERLKSLAERVIEDAKNVRR